MAENYSPKNFNTDGGDRSVFGGEVNFTGLPTSAPAGSGQLWNDGGTLKISPVHVAPAFTVDPTLSGTAEVGSTLTVTAGTATGTPTPTRTREWLADGEVIAGASATTYVLTEAEEGKVITVRSIATNPAGQAVSISNATAAVAPGG